MVCVHISPSRVGNWQQLAESLTRKEIETLEFQLNIVGLSGHYLQVDVDNRQEFTAYVSPHANIDSLLPVLEQAK